MMIFDPTQIRDIVFEIKPLGTNQTYELGQLLGREPSPLAIEFSELHLNVDYATSSPTLTGDESDDDVVRGHAITQNQIAENLGTFAHHSLMYLRKGRYIHPEALPLLIVFLYTSAAAIISRRLPNWELMRDIVGKVIMEMMLEIAREYPDKLTVTPDQLFALRLFAPPPKN